MSRKLFHIRNKLRSLCRGCCPAYTAVESDRLACYLALEGPEKEASGMGGVGEVEPCPVDVVGWRGEGVIGVPEEGGGIGEVAGGGGVR
jgi:hypothetical protein